MLIIFWLCNINWCLCCWVGEYTTGVMGNNEILKRNAVLSALKSGEYATSLDFNRYLKKQLNQKLLIFVILQIQDMVEQLQLECF